MLPIDSGRRCFRHLAQRHAITNRAARVAGWAALGVAVAAAIGALLPLAPDPLGIGLDQSFAATLHFHAATRQSTGTQLISTFGPLGFAFYTIYLPETFAWLFGLRALLTGATCAALAWIGYASWRTPWGAAVTVAASAPFLASPDVWFLVLPLLALLVELPRDRRPPLALRVVLGAAIGLAALIKFTSCLAAIAVLAPLSASALITRRAVPATAVAAAAGGAAAWFVTGYGWSDWVSYFDWSLRDIVPGYSRAMQLPVHPVLLVYAATVSLALLVAGGLLIRRRLRGGALAGLVVLAAVIFLTWKAGLVRGDIHPAATFYTLLVLSVLLGVLSNTRLAGLLLIVALPAWIWWNIGQGSLYFRAVFPFEAFARLAAAPARLDSGALAEMHAAQVAKLQRFQFPSVAGPMDLYSVVQGVLYARPVDYRPRPVFQSYMAYTPRLAQANADFLRGPRAPEWIVFQHSPQDRHFPTLEDATSWPLLLTHYRLVDRVGTFSVLQRRAAPLVWRLEPIATSESRTGATIPVPVRPDELIWVRLDLEETLRDRVVTTLLSAPLIFVDVTLRSGRTKQFRLIPAIARAGFLLSPPVDSDADFRRLMVGDPALRRDLAVSELRIDVRPAPGIAAAPRRVTAEFSRLVIEAPAAAGGLDAPARHEDGRGETGLYETGDSSWSG